MNQRQPAARPLTVRVFVFPGVRLLDVTGPIEVFTSANDFCGRYRLEMVSEHGLDVITSGGTRLGADLSVGDLRQPADARPAETEGTMREPVEQGTGRAG